MKDLLAEQHRVRLTLVEKQQVMVFQIIVHVELAPVNPLKCVVKKAINVLMGRFASSDVVERLRERYAQL